ncbi:MAG: hypothetical protein ACODAJ_11305, partial [Planctomycetota bacterium]
MSTYGLGRWLGWVVVFSCCAPLLGGGELQVSRHPRVPAAFTFTPQRNDMVSVRDDGADVTSVGYAARRGFPATLRLVAGDLSGDDWAERPVAYGQVVVDRRRGRLRFHA